MRILFAGGGTGGHIAPGIALAEAALRAQPSSEFLFVVTGRKAEEPFFSGVDYQRAALNAPRSGGSIFSRVALPFRFLLAALRSGGLLENFSPDVVVGLGGYASAPVVYAAHSRGIPSVLLEQNAVPGRATRRLASKAREIYCQFSCTAHSLGRRGTPVVTGTPVRAEILEKNFSASCAALKLDFERRTILVMGGSQGAGGLNKVVLSILPRLERDYGLLQIVHQTGSDDYDYVRDEYGKYNIESRVFRFINPVAPALHLADIVICRAGATGIAEITALGLPSILLPYPHSLDGEQRANAMQLVERGAAFLVDEKSPGAGNELYTALSRLLDDGDAARAAAENSVAMGRRGAAEEIVERIAAIAGMPADTLVGSVGAKA